MAGIRSVFVDANVLIAGADSRSGASHAVLTMGEIGLFQLVVSQQILVEAERNLRKKLPRLLPNFATQMAHLTLVIVPDPPAREVAHWSHIIEAKDAPVLAAAIRAAPDRFVTLDTKHFTPEIALSSQLTIVTPSQLIQEIRNLVSGGISYDT